VKPYDMYRNLEGASAEMPTLFEIAISVAAAFAGSYFVDFIIDKMNEIRR
jgi:hypothetical protein